VISCTREISAKPTKGGPPWFPILTSLLGGGGDGEGGSCLAVGVTHPFSSRKSFKSVSLVVAKVVLGCVHIHEEVDAVKLTIGRKHGCTPEMLGLDVLKFTDLACSTQKIL